MRLRARHGLTLIELVIALTITGISTAAGYGAFAMLSDRRAVAAKRSREVARASAIRETLRRWLSEARLTIEEDDIVFQGIDGVKRADLSVGAGAPDDELTFYTLAPTPVAQAGTVVRLFLDRSDSTVEQGLVAELRARGSTVRQRVELAPEVGALDLKYLSSVARKSEWASSWISTSLLPAGVRMTIAADSGQALHPLLALPITVSLEAAR